MLKHSRADLYTWDMEALIDAVQSLETEVMELEDRLAAQDSQWISVADQLPQTNNWVLVLVQAKYATVPDVNIAQYNPFSQEWRARMGYRIESQGQVTHWQPVPQPPTTPPARQAGLW